MYNCLTSQHFENGRGYSLVPLREQDLESIRIWRNDQIEILRQKLPITPEQQIKYFNEIIAPSFKLENPTQILFSFLENSQCIGYGGLTHIDWEARHAEVSFLLNPIFTKNPLHYQKIFSYFLQLLFRVSFDNLGLHRLFTETYAYRTDHIAVLEASGFKYEGRMRDHLFKRGKWEDSIIHGILAKEET